MAHGAGGKATPTLVEGLLAPGARRSARSTTPARRVRRASPLTTDSVRRQADPLPRRLDRRAGGERHGQRPRGRGRPAARADRSRSCSRRGSRADDLRAEVEAIAAAARRGGRRSRRAATRRSSSAAAATDVRHARPGSGAVDPRALARRPASLVPGDRILVSGLDRRPRHGGHARARRVRARRARSSRTRGSLWPAVDALLDAAGPALRCMRDATRGGVATVLNELARASGVAVSCARRAVPGAAGGRRRVRDPRDRPDVRRERGQARRRSSRRRRADARARRAARRARLRGRRGDRRGAGRIPRGWCSWRRAFGGRRVMDMLVGDPLPRIC